MWRLTCLSLFDEVEPLLPHLHPGDAFSRQVRVDGGELATDGFVLDDLFDGRPQLLHALNALVLECIFDRILTLVALCRTTCAVFQNFQDDICLQLSPLQGSLIHEQKSLGRSIAIIWQIDKGAVAAGGGL